MPSRISVGAVWTWPVHLEMAFTLDTDAFLSALLRFEQRRGTPAAYYSDNGTKSTGAQPESKDCLAHLDSSNIKDKLAKRLIEWHFNPPGAPRFGGAWESLTKLAKHAPSRILRPNVNRWDFGNRAFDSGKSLQRATSYVPPTTRPNQKYWRHIIYKLVAHSNCRLHLVLLVLVRSCRMWEMISSRKLRPAYHTFSIDTYSPKATKWNVASLCNPTGRKFDGTSSRCLLKLKPLSPKLGLNSKLRLQ